MGTIVTVHGTFAHLEVPGQSAASASSASYWWRDDSPFANELKSLVQGEEGAVTVKAFTWSGDNSERERRLAGRSLFQVLQQLEAAGEPYCIVAHSHGGSVVSAALLQAAARKQQLPGLKRWITIGTPFVELRRERFLFMRLSIILKAMYVASFMLLLIFAGATIGELWDGSVSLENSGALWRLVVGGLFAALPGVVFLLIAWLRERRQRYFYRPRIKRRAKEFFESRWLSLTHEDDEAVRGLGSLRAVSLPIFDRQFAVPLISLFAVFMLPAVYLFAINSSSVMLGLSDTLSKHVYQLDELAAQTQSYQQSRKAMRDIRGSLRETRKKANDVLQPLEAREQAKRSLRVQQRSLQEQRKQLQEAFPELPKVQRADRFRRKFLEKNGRPCGNGQLCGGGEDRALNAQLLLHVITDEVSSLFVDEEVRYSAVGRIASYLLPVILVPVVLGMIAILWVLIAQVVARWFSRIASGWLDRMTWTQIRRSAVGNDTEDEIALGTAPYPAWLGGGQRFLPMAVSADITQCSNDATFKSLAKFRNALSDLAFTEGRKRETDNVLAYLNWNELIHTCYFAVPSFTMLVALAIARSGGFRPAPELEVGASSQAWLSEAELSTPPAG